MKTCKFPRIAAASAAALAFLIAAAAPLAAQEGFGFGDPAAGAAGADAAGANAAPAAAGVKTSGELAFSGTAWIDPAAGAADLAATPVAAGALGRLEFAASGGAVDSRLKLKLDSAALAAHPGDIIDEASVRLFAGPLELEGGLLKLSWGKADSMGPLDALNPLDFSDPTAGEGLDAKLARPMLRAAWALGDFTKLEAVGEFGFAGHRLALAGRWMPKRLAAQKAQARAGFYYGSNPTANGGRGDGLYANYYGQAFAAAYTGTYATAYATAYQTAYGTYLATHPGDTAGAAAAAVAADATNNATANSQALTAANATMAANGAAVAAQAGAAADAMVADLLVFPDTNVLDYSQAGLRLTTTLGPVDLGLQYFYGFLPTPAVSPDPAAIAAAGNHAVVAYNRYHQAGLDAALILLGVNLRFEAAADLTEDLAGDDPLVYNPSLAWSVGGDRDLFAGINLNLQAAGSYRLFDAKVGTAAYDIESGTDLTRTRITALLSQKLKRDTVEWKVAAVVGVEDRDYLVRPSLALSFGEGKLELSGGYFGGDADGELGQFAANSYARVAFSHQF